MKMQGSIKLYEMLKNVYVFKQYMNDIVYGILCVVDTVMCKWFLHKWLQQYVVCEKQVSCTLILLIWHCFLFFQKSYLKLVASSVNSKIPFYRRSTLGTSYLQALLLYGFVIVKIEIVLFSRIGLDDLHDTCF